MDTGTTKNQKAVTKAQKAFQDAIKVFNRLPREVQVELGDLIEDWSEDRDGSWRTQAIVLAFEEWLEGGRI